MELVTLKSIQKNFLIELKHAKENKPSSLSYIPNRIPSIPLVKNGEIFETLSIGGGFTKKALVRKTHDKIEILQQSAQQQPPFKTKRDFLHVVDTLLENDITTLAVNLAQAVDPVFADNKLDGILPYATKESTFTGLIGKKVGEEIEKYILKKRKNKLTVSVANDTICLALSGLTKYSWENLVCGIVGTGYNIAFFDKKNDVINLESGNFNKFQQTEEGKIIDQSSVKPEAYIFEKETAGGYLYKHFNIICKQKNIKMHPLKNSKDLDFTAQSSNVEISTIAKDVLQNSALLVACQISAMAEYKQKNITCVMEGSLFWKGFEYKETVTEAVKKLTNYTVDIVEIENSPILGAAKLVC